MSFCNIPTAVWVCITQMCLEGLIFFSDPAESGLGYLHVGDLDPPNCYPGIPQKTIFREQCVPFLGSFIIELVQVITFQSSHPLIQLFGWGPSNGLYFYRRSTATCRASFDGCLVVLLWILEWQNVRDTIKDATWVGHEEVCDESSSFLALFSLFFD